MAGITEHHSTNATKLMLIGDSGTGKTGALVSLVLAGYKLRIIDLDNGIDIIKNYLTSPASPYYAELQSKHIDIDDAVRYTTFTEQMKAMNGRIMPAKASVWQNTMNMLSHWKETEKDKDGKTVVVHDEGNPADWGPEKILVLDSLTFLSFAALNQCQALRGQLGTTESTKGYDMRLDIRAAQSALEFLFQLLYSSNFKPNVILIAHILYRNPEGQDNDTSFGKRGYPSSVGIALSPRIPRYYNNVIQCIIEGSGQGEKHKLVTMSWNGVAAKTSAPSSVKPKYDINTGLAEFFRDVHK